MQLSDVFLGLGEENFAQVLRAISIGRLKTYQLYERLKVRMHLNKLNSESLRKSAPRFWVRLQEGDQEFATDLAQAVLVCHLDMIKDVLDFLGVPHEEGFFSKDLDPSQHLTENWQERTYEHFREKYPAALLLFYINHLDHELSREPRLFTPAAV